MAAERDAVAIRAEIDQARAQLATTVDELANRLAPARLSERLKASVKQKVTSPAGIAVVGGVTVVLTLVVVRNLRRSKG